MKLGGQEGKWEVHRERTGGRKTKCARGPKAADLWVPGPKPLSAGDYSASPEQLTQ